MSVENTANLEREIVSYLQDFSGMKSIDLDQMLSRDIGICGADGVQILYELEDRFGVELTPLVEANTVLLPPTWLDRLQGRKHGPAVADLTVRQLIDYIAGARS